MIFASTPKTLTLAGASLMALQLAACSPTITTQGNMLHAAAIEQIRPETSMRADVERLWGPPSAVSSFDPNVWYYIGETMSQKGVFEPEIQKRQIVKVTFNGQDNVTGVEVLDNADVEEIAIQSRHTPTAGKEFTAVQQFLSNIGKFNKDGGGGSKIPGM